MQVARFARSSERYARRAAALAGRVRMGRRFDSIVIGAGQAGPFLAARLCAAGEKVALIEREHMGGTCVNVGCTPTKTWVASARAIQQARRGAEMGFSVSGGPIADMAQIQARKNAIVEKSRSGLESWLTKLDGFTLIRGEGRFASASSIEVAGEICEAKKIFLNVGARPAIPDFPGVHDVPFLTSTTLLAIEAVPEHLVVVGGSYVGLEFAQMFRRFGAEVTVVERGAQLLPHEDADVAAAVREALEKEGIHFRLNSECIRLGMREGGPLVHVSCSSGDPEVRGTHVLLAVGRTPNTDSLDLERAGLAADEHGFISVDDQLRTAVPGIWALGDCNGHGAFTHTSYNDYEIVAANLLDRGNRKLSDRIPVHALFVDPPLAQVGMTERAVREAGIPALIGKRAMTRVSRAIERSETEGFMKVLVHRDTERILGASIVGTEADEAIHCIATAMYADKPASLLRHSMHIHPTVAELIPTVFGELKPLE